MLIISVSFLSFLRLYDLQEIGPNQSFDSRNTVLDSQIQRTDLWLPRGHGVGGRKYWEFGISRGKLLYREWINNKVLLYSTGNYSQYPVIKHNGKEYEKDCIYIYN